MDEEKKVKHSKMSNNIESLVAEGKKCLLPGMDKDSVSNIDMKSWRTVTYYYTL